MIVIMSQIDVFNSFSATAGTMSIPLCGVFVPPYNVTRQCTRCNYVFTRYNMVYLTP